MVPTVPVVGPLKFHLVCALGPLAYFRWVIDDKLSLDILSPSTGGPLLLKANILLPNAVHGCASVCTADNLKYFRKRSLMSTDANCARDDAVATKKSSHGFGR